MINIKATWQVNQSTGSTTLKDGSNCVTVPATDTILDTVSLTFSIPASDKMFFNGYQTWTYCPEYTSQSKVRGINHLPKFLINKFAFDRYGDYHFIDYPSKKGMLHGESYCYFRSSMLYTLIASLDETNGYTCFNYDAGHETMTVTRDCRGVMMSALADEDGQFHAFDLFLAQGHENAVFDSWFDAMNRHSFSPKIKGYSSWYNHYQDINEQGIYDDLNGAAQIFGEGDLFQIDDGWEPFVGDWEATDPIKFPNGLKPVADSIHKKGFKAGLWLAPFICEEKSALFREHKDWLLEVDKTPWKDGCNWSGFYSLDIDNPEVQQYLTDVFRRVFDEWGFDLVKLDFLYAAAPFGTPGTDKASSYLVETRAGRMIRALKFLRKICGDKLILGCGTPVMPAFGLVDYCRVSCDVGLDWNDKPFMRIIHRERVSTKQAIENSLLRRSLNGRAHGNDPDVFFLRDNNIKLTESEKIYLATVNALFGSVWLTSDNLNAYTPQQRALYKQLRRLVTDATDIKIDSDTFAVSYKLDGKQCSINHPHK